MKIIIMLANLDIDRVARDRGSSHLVNFAFALTAFVALGAGILASACALIGWSIWLGVIGVILTFVGCGLYGWSLCDKQ